MNRKAGDQPRLTRKDFLDSDSYAEYLRRSGLEPVDEKGNWMPISGDSLDAKILRGVYGNSERQFQQAWGSWGLSEGIKLKDFIKAYRAVAFANRIGSVLNVHIIIVWSTVDKSSESAVARAHKDLMERFGKWCDKRKIPRHWIWVLEKTIDRGLHSHILCSVPRPNAHGLKTWVFSCIKTVTKKEAIQASTAPTKTVVIRHRKDKDIRAQWILFRYLMKGLPLGEITDAGDKTKSRPTSEVLGIHSRPAGKMQIQRVRISRELDSAAQRKASFGETAFDRGAVTPGDLYSDEYYRHFAHELMFPDGTI